MAFLGGSGDTASTVVSLLGVDEYIGNQMRIAGGWHNAARAQDAYAASANKMSATASRLTSAGGAIATSAIVMGYSFVKAAADMQATRGGFATMLGSMDAAKSKISELKQFAASTPFDFKESAKGAQRLLAMGISGERLVPTMKSVAGAVAAAQGNTEDFLGVLNAIGQIKTKGTLGLEEMQQMSERGIPAMRLLQRELGLTKDQMNNLGSQDIDADRAIGALLAGFDKEFGNALVNAAGSYNNAESNFRGALDEFKTVAGETLLPMATDALQGLTGLIEKGSAFIELHPEFAKFVIIFAAIGGVLLIAAGRIKQIQINAMLAAAATKTLADETGRVGVGGGISGGGRGGLGRGGAVIGSDAAEASDRIARVHNARVRASKELSQAMRDKGNAAPGSDEEKAAQRRIDRARQTRNRLNQVEKDARDTFGATDEGQGVGGGAALGHAKDIAAAIASGEDAATVLQDKLLEIGQSAGGEFLGDPKATLAKWKSSAVATFGSIKAFMGTGVSLPGGGGINTVNAFGGLGRFGSLGAQMTAGGALTGAALGVGAGLGARADLKTLGVGEGAASLYAGILGAVTAGATAFFPPAALIVGAAQVFRLGVDRFYTAPLEKAATEGTLGPEGEKAIAEAKTSAEKSKIYFDLAEKARKEGDNDTAASFMLSANSYRKRDKREKIQAEKDATQARLTQAQKEMREKDMLENPEKYTGVDPNASPMIRAARGIGPNGAFDTAEDPAPFSMNRRVLEAQGRPASGLDFATNYGQGTNPNDYRERAQQSAAAIDSGAGYTVEENRNGTRRVVLDIPRDPNADLGDRLRRHNQLKTRF